MPEYQYVGITAEGKRTKGSIIAANQAEFNEVLKSRGEYCLSFEEKEEAVKNKRKAMKLKQLALFFRQLSTMLKAGITIVNSLEIIAKQIDDKKIQEIIWSIYGTVQEGKSLAEAMKDTGGAFPPFAVNMVQSGEMSGSLDNVVDKLAEYYEKDMKTRNKVIQAMMYPMILAVVVVLVVIVLLAFVVPTILENYDTLGAELPLTTRILLSISDFVQTKWYIIAIVLVILYGIGKYLLSMRNIRMAFDKFKFSIPIFGKLYLTIVASRFARCLYALFSGGTALITSIEQSAKVVGNTYVEYHLLNAKDEISKGKSLSTALKEIDIFPSMMLSLFTIGEQSGSLDSMILRTADLYEEESDNAITRMVSLLEPILLIVMAVIVGFIVVAIIQAVYGNLGAIA